MALIDTLKTRASSKCELCGNTESLHVYEVQPTSKVDENSCVLLCSTCNDQIQSNELEQNHWRCLNDSMWSEVAPVQVLAYRLLTQLNERDLLEQLYLDDSLIEWARAGLPAEEEIDSSAPTIDSNGTRLMEGDSVTLIKDLDVKGGGFTAKRGTLVKNITLTNNPKHIEGRVNGIQIVLVAAYLKKA